MAPKTAVPHLESAKQVSRPVLSDLDISPGKRVRLHRLLYEHGLRNGTLMVLPIDQGIEHGPLNFFANPPSKDPRFQWELAVQGGYNAIACHWGLARAYMKDYAGRVPLILKINGKTNVPSDEAAFSALTATVEDAVTLGAAAVGYTLDVGSPRQDDDMLQYLEVREACERWGMPLVVWAYPRGAAIEKKGGRDSIYAVDYASRLAHELGADIIKLNVPVKSDKDAQQPKPYNELEWDYESGVRRVVETAGKSMVLFSGGSKVSDEDLLDKARITMEQGSTGLIFGRNMWQRPMDEALALTERIKDLLRRFPA
jgi:class I fructose-bisphosphate aldolase